MRVLMIVFVVLAVCPLSSCRARESLQPRIQAGSTVVLRGKDVVRTGMNKDQVVAILGQPSEKTKKARIVTNPDPHYYWQGDIWIFRRYDHGVELTWWARFESDVVAQVEYFENWPDR